jgi:phage-related protein
MNRPKLSVKFYENSQGREPVREWLLDLNASDRKTIGDEIRTVQFGWPIGMPLVRKLDKDLWEIRIDLADRIVRVLFTIEKGHAILLHGFIKKTQKIPAPDLATAKRRLSDLRANGE